MISKLKPTDFKVLSLTTVATPHHGTYGHIVAHDVSLAHFIGSSFADHMFSTIGRLLSAPSLERHSHSVHSTEPTPDLPCPP